MYKGKNKISHRIGNSFLEYTNNNYDLRNVTILKSKIKLAVYHRSEGLSSLAPKT